MKIKSLLLYSLIGATLAGCSKKTHEIVPIVPQKPYSITEDFESGSKAAYKLDTIQLITGKWILNDALIGATAADVKNETKSVRLRTGYLAMDFDIAGLKMLYIKHAKYGNDANSTWQLLISTDSGQNFTQLGTDITDTSTTLVTDSFKVSIIGKVRFQIKKDGKTRINLDDITFKGTGDPEITIGAPDTNPTDTTGTTAVAPGRGTPVDGADAPPTSGDNSDLLMGNPSGAQTATVMGNNYLIDQHYYTESYNMTNAGPNWVSWHLDAANITGNVKRQNNFAAFTGLPTGWYEVQNNSFTGSGFDRGHNCPSGDRTSSTDANSATFLMSNMVPQAPNNNQKTWEALESYLRTQVLSGNEVYIIMGAYGSGGIGSNGGISTSVNGGKVNVPSNIWKVAVILPVGNSDLSRVSASTRVIAVNTPNINTINPDWKQYIVTIRDIEKATGYNLLSSLPQQVQDAVETKKDAGN